jgi:hypothetical protein
VETSNEKTVLPLLVLVDAPVAAAEREDRGMKQMITQSQDQTTTAGSPDTFTGDVRVSTLFPADANASYSGAYVTFQPGGAAGGGPPPHRAPHVGSHRVCPPPHPYHIKITT